MKHPFPSATAVQQLGYGSVTPRTAPVALLMLLPTGLSLDPGTAG